MSRKNAVCLLSGGQDSTTALFWAKLKFNNVFALIIDYGQRHLIEIESAVKIAGLAEIPWKILKLESYFQSLTTSSLIGSGSVCDSHPTNPNLPASFVPGRNLIFVSSASILAQQMKYTNVITGVCQTDYSGYPDCRNNTIKSLNVALNLGMDSDIEVHTPLMWLNKKETVELAVELPGCMNALKYSHTCYEGKRPPCMECPSCILRQKGFEETNIIDPILKRNINE